MVPLKFITFTLVLGNFARIIIKFHAQRSMSVKFSLSYGGFPVNENKRFRSFDKSETTLICRTSTFRFYDHLRLLKSDL